MLNLEKDNCCAQNIITALRSTGLLPSNRSEVLKRMPSSTYSREGINKNPEAWTAPFEKILEERKAQNYKVRPENVWLQLVKI